MQPASLAPPPLAGGFDIDTIAREGELDALAREVKQAQDGCTPLPLLTTRHAGLDTAASYAVAARVQALRRAEGAQPVGRKIGFTNSRIWPQYGVHAPIWGWMYDHTVRRLDARAGPVSLQGLASPRIEPEIVLHFHTAPATGADAMAVLACIDWVAHGFEIVQSHFADWRFEAADAIADGGLHGALLLGPPQPVDTLGPGLAAALSSFELQLDCDAARVDRGSGANVLGSPLAAVAHLVQVLAASSGEAPLMAGEMVTTGTITAAWPVRAGQTWRTHLQGIRLPGLTVEFN